MTLFTARVKHEASWMVTEVERKDDGSVCEFTAVLQHIRGE